MLLTEQPSQQPQMSYAVTLTETYTEVQHDTMVTEAKAEAGGETLCCKQVS